MKYLLFFLIAVGSLFSCMPPPANTADFMAVFTFSRAPHTQDVRPMISMQYMQPNGSWAVSYDMASHIPMHQGSVYRDTVRLNDVDLDNLHHIEIGCQQGYVCANPNVNPFKVGVYKDGVMIFEDYHNAPPCYGGIIVYQ